MSEDMRDKIAEIILIEMGYPSDSSDAQYTADEIITALPNMVVPLVWEDHSSPNAPLFVAKNQYCKSYKVGQSSSWGHWGLEVGVKFLGGYGSEDEAKAAAQAHHVAHIMAAFGGEEK